MKVLLISANTLTAPYPVYPLGLDYIAGALADKHEVRIADMNTFRDEKSLGKFIQQFSPEVIGISLRNIDNTDTTDPRGFVGVYHQLIEEIRRHSKALLVLGGSGLTIFPREIMNALKADYGIMGEGERLAQLLNAIENKKEIAAIPGVVRRDMQPSSPEPLGTKFSRNFDRNHSHLKFYLKNGGMLNLQTKRGCRFNCVYCTYPHIEGRDQRLIPPEEVADTARRLQMAGAKYFFITDALFNSDISHNIAVARAFKKAGVSIPWGAFFAPLKLPADYFKIMADAGLTHVEFGTESLSNPVLEAYGKPFRREHIFNTHAVAVEAGLYVAHYVLLGGPGETPVTLSETLVSIDKLEKSVIFFFCGMRIYPNTALYDIAVQKGQISPGQNILEPVFYRPLQIDAEEIIRRVNEQAKDRSHWVVGSGGQKTADIIARLYERGHTGPLWEHLIR